MQTLLLRADEKVLEKIVAVINQFSKEGNNIEILNSDIFEKEKAMITNALEQEKKGNTFEHNDVWNELLK